MALTQRCLWLILLSLSLLFFLSVLRSSTDTFTDRYCSKTNALTKQELLTRFQANDRDEGINEIIASCPHESNDSLEIPAQLIHMLCEVEFSSIFFSRRPKPLVVAKDITPSRYYAQRDLQGWNLAYRNINFEVSEISYHTAVKLSDLAVFLCFGSRNIDTHCLKPATYPALMQGQRFNQIHGFRNTLWRKDTFCFTLREALANFSGPKNFTFPCWVLPHDHITLRKVMESQSREWIVKPSSSGEGHGIFIINSYKELEHHHNTDGFVIQPLLVDPYLINGRKFDLRTYVLVTSISPPRIYFYKEGLVRFSASKYNRSNSQGRKEDEYLTNTSVGKKYTNLANLTWSYAQLKTHLSNVGVDTEQLFQRVYESIVRSLLAAEYRFLRNSQSTLGGYDCDRCFQLMGVDVIFDSNLNPIIIEMNGLPSMQLSHDLGVPPDPKNQYTAMKFGLMHDTLQILFTPTSTAGQLAKYLQMLRVGIKPGPLCDKTKHLFCVDHKDIQKLLDSRREYVNKGGFIRIYPSASGEKYSVLIRHMDSLISKHFKERTVTTLWQVHHLYTALENLYNLS